MAGLNITEVRIHIVGRDDTNLKAYASITLDDCFVVHGIKIIQGDRGLFVGMPRRKREDETYQDVAHPINNDTRHFIEERVLQRYEEELAGWRPDQGPDGNVAASHAAA